MTSKKSDSSAARARILKLLQDHVGRTVSREQIDGAAKIHDWPRRIRELRAEGWRIKSEKTGYVLENMRKGKGADTTPISEKIRYAVLRRDSSKCRRCGRTPEDGIKLVVDHIIPRTWGGRTEEENLWALCEPCNLGKKDHESDVDAGAMRAVLKETSGKGRLLAYLRLKVGEIVRKEELDVVAGIHDYPRRLRELRDEGWDIVSFYEDKSLKVGDYILRSIKKG